VVTPPRARPAPLSLLSTPPEPIPSAIRSARRSPNDASSTAIWLTGCRLGASPRRTCNRRSFTSVSIISRRECTEPGSPGVQRQVELGIGAASIVLHSLSYQPCHRLPAPERRLSEPLVQIHREPDRYLDRRLPISRYHDIPMISRHSIFWYG